MERGFITFKIGKTHKKVVSYLEIRGKTEDGLKNIIKKVKQRNIKGEFYFSFKKVISY